MNGRDENDAQNNCQNGGGHVIRNGPASNFARNAHVQGPHGRHQAGDDQGQDQRLEHPQEKFSHVGHVHHLTFSPFLCKLVSKKGVHK